MTQVRVYYVHTQNKCTKIAKTLTRIYEKLQCKEEPYLFSCLVQTDRQKTTQDAVTFK